MPLEALLCADLGVLFGAAAEGPSVKQPNNDKILTLGQLLRGLRIQMSLLWLEPLFASIACCGVVISIFWYFGAARHPPFATFFMILSACIPVVMVVGLLPYDISLSLFGSTTKSDTTLTLIFNILYWVSFMLTWVIVPLIVTYQGYSNSITIKHRIWMTIRENLIFYGSVGGVCGVGFTILYFTGTLTLSSVLPMVVAMANGYGLIVLCLAMGYGLVSLPKKIWGMADPQYRYRFYINRLANETEKCASIVADSDAALVHCDNARKNVRGRIKEDFIRLGEPRAEKLNQLKAALPIPSKFYTSECTNKKIQKVRKIEWDMCSDGQLEDFFSLMDTTAASLEQMKHIILDSGDEAAKAINEYMEMVQHSTKPTFIKVMKRILALFVACWSAVYYWGEVSLIFSYEEYSAFYMLSHINMHAIIDILFISTPILTYLVFVGGWALTQMRLGSFFRFIKDATNANSLNYWAVLLCRLGPTAAYHYMTQIHATDSNFVKVVGVMDTVIFIGTKWNIYSPILMIVVSIFFAFNLWDRIVVGIGCKKYASDSNVDDNEGIEVGLEVLYELHPELRSTLDDNNIHLTFDAPKTIGKKKKKEEIGVGSELL